MRDAKENDVKVTKEIKLCSRCRCQLTSDGIVWREACAPGEAVGREHTIDRCADTLVGQRDLAISHCDRATTAR